MEHTQEFPSHNTLKTCGRNEKRLLMKDKFTAKIQLIKEYMVVLSKKIDNMLFL